MQQHMVVALALAVGLTTCLASFQMALGAHFIRAGKLPRATAALVVLSAMLYFAAMLHLFVTGAPRPPLAAAAAVLMTCSLLLFRSARRSSPPRTLAVAFGEADPAQIVTTGPYRYMRHPFYVSYMLYWAAAFLSAPHPLIGAGTLTILVLYVILAGREERALLASPLGPEYRQYQSRSGRFLPRLPLR